MIGLTLLSVFALWVAVLGLTTIVGQHGAFIRWTGRSVHFFLRQVGALAGWAWRHYRQFILGFGLGFIAALYIFGRFQ